MADRSLPGTLALVAGLGVGLAAVMAASSTIAEDAGADLVWHDCLYEQYTDRTLRCGHLSVSGPAPTSLPLAVVQHDPDGPSRSAMLYIRGGPGIAAGLGGVRLRWESWAENVGLDQDLVVYDQRGTGLTDIRPTCPEERATRREILARGQYSQHSSNLRRDARAACHARLVAEGYDLEQYTTLRNAEDIVALLDALPYESWTLLGSSYGSLLALEVLRRRPDRLRSVILESVQPPDLPWTWESEFILESGMAMIASACSKSTMDEPYCESSAEEVSAVLLAELEALSERPRWIAVDGRRNELPYKARVGPYEMLMALDSELTNPDGANTARDALMELAAGRDTSLEILLGSWAMYIVDSYVSIPVFRSVMCDGYRDWPTREGEEPRAAAGLYEKFIPLGKHTDSCDYWIESRAPDAMRRPVVSDIPVLLFSGEYDPLTPASWADRAATTLERGHHIVIPRGGHGSLGNDPCAESIMRAFLADPTATPDRGCLDDTMPGIRTLQ